jgi:hypothetical protein
MFRRQVISTSFVVGLVFLPTLASAASQSFDVLNNNAKPGMLMSLTLNTGVVEPASDKNANRLIGVYEPATESSLNKQAGQAPVATDGMVQTLASTLNGPILVGDKVGTSSVVGVGAKSIGSGYVVGTAQSSLDSKTKGTISAEVKDAAGHSHKVYIASIPVVVKVQPSATITKPTVVPKTVVPKTIQSVADSIAGKHVTLIALLLGFVLMAMGILFAGLITSTAVRSGFIGISRQPLAKRIITRQILRALALSFVILSMGLASTYLILKFL